MMMVWTGQQLVLALVLTCILLSQLAAGDSKYDDMAIKYKLLWPPDWRKHRKRQPLPPNKDTVGHI